MADIDLKIATPDGSLPSNGFLFGADSQSAASPSVYPVSAIKSALVGGSTTQVQFNDDGSTFGGDSGLTFDKTTRRLSLASAGQLAFSTDLLLSRRAAANLRFGAADAAAPVAQTLSVQSVVAGTTNTAGANLTITGSQGTGTGAGGSIIFQVAPAGGSGTAQNALVNALTIQPNSDSVFGSGSGFLPRIEPTDLAFYLGNSVGQYSAALDNNNGLILGSDKFISFSSTATNANSAGDTRLYRDAANALALRNGTNAQTFNVYNTFTNASNYERGIISYQSNVLYIGQEVAGTGVARPVNIYNSGAQEIGFSTNATKRWTIDSSGNLAAVADNTYDIGAVAATRPRNVYVAGTVSPGRGVTVAGLPTPSTGMMARVTDATAPVVGSTVVGGGAAAALVWYNGANWTVIGV